MLAPVLYVFIALLLWFILMLVPSIGVIFFTHKNYMILKSIQFWQIAGAACLPSILGLVLFLALYRFFKGPGEGGIAGLAFVLISAAMFCISTCPSSNSKLCRNWSVTQTRFGGITSVRRPIIILSGVVRVGPFSCLGLGHPAVF